MTVQLHVPCPTLVSTTFPTTVRLAAGDCPSSKRDRPYVVLLRDLGGAGDPSTRGGRSGAARDGKSGR